MNDSIFMDCKKTSGLEVTVIQIDFAPDRHAGPLPCCWIKCEQLDNLDRAQRWRLLKNKLTKTFTR